MPARASARLEHNPTGLFAKGFLGTGGVTGGRLADEDFPPALRRYSKTLSPIKDGDIGYGVIDFGYDVLRRDGYKLGGFLGYQFASELYNGYGCRQVAGEAPCARPYPTGMKTLGESMQWNALRVGRDRRGAVRPGQAEPGRRLPAGREPERRRPALAATRHQSGAGGRPRRRLLPGGDHRVRPDAVRQRRRRRHATGSSRPTRRTTAFPFSSPSPMKFETGRYGGFAQLSYRLADFGFGETGAPAALVRKD
ncbi:hypothetical protein ACU4GA_27590 [Methylobacterium oryzae CBMB20]